MVDGICEVMPIDIVHYDALEVHPIGSGQSATIIRDFLLGVGLSKERLLKVVPE